MMCSACEGSYEDPDMTGWDDGEEPAPIIEADDYPLLPETMEREFAQPDPALQDVFAYLRAVKRFGLALEQLGRPCDKERP